MSKPKGARITGPYREKDGVRYRIFDEAGRSSSVKAKTEEEAFGAAQIALAKVRQKEAQTVAAAIEKYKECQIEKGNKPSSIATTRTRLRYFLGPALDRDLSRLTSFELQRLYKLRCEGCAVDTHRSELAEVRSLLNFCVGQGLIPRNPAGELALSAGAIRGIGKRRHGKPQLRVTESEEVERAAWAAWNVDRELGAAAVLIALGLALRACEVVTLLAQDVDAKGAVLWVGEQQAKSEAARRQLAVPAPLRPLLLQLASSATPLAPLFPAPRAKSGLHDPDWVTDWSVRLCKRAGARRVTAHGLRGTRASLDKLSGLSSREVAERLGHEDPSTTERSYIRSAK